MHSEQKTTPKQSVGFWMCQPISPLLISNALVVSTVSSGSVRLPDFLTYGDRDWNDRIGSHWQRRRSSRSEGCLTSIMKRMLFKAWWHSPGQGYLFYTDPQRLYKHHQRSERPYLDLLGQQGLMFGLSFGETPRVLLVAILSSPQSPKLSSRCGLYQGKMIAGIPADEIGSSSLKYHWGFVDTSQEIAILYRPLNLARRRSGSLWDIVAIVGHAEMHSSCLDAVVRISAQQRTLTTSEFSDPSAWCWLSGGPLIVATIDDTRALEICSDGATLSAQIGPLSTVF